MTTTTKKKNNNNTNKQRQKQKHPFVDNCYKLNFSFASRVFAMAESSVFHQAGP